MNEKPTRLDCLIGGKKYTLEGAEPEEYIQQLAWYLDKKITEVKRAKPMSGILDANSMQIIINIVDDLFKQKNIAEHAVAKAFKMNEDLTQYKTQVTNLTADFKTQFQAQTEEYRAKISHLLEENALLKQRLNERAAKY